jgi:hypothetical protein
VGDAPFVMERYARVHSSCAGGGKVGFVAEHALQLSVMDCHCYT